MSATDLRTSVNTMLHPLSSAQQGIWLGQLLAPDCAGYSIGCVMRFEGTIHRDAWEHAIATVIARHDALRTVLVQGTPLPDQHVLQTLPFSLPWHDYSAHADGEQRVWDHLCQAMKTPFALYGQPLWDFQWLQASAERGYCLYRCHHLIADGMSLGMLSQQVVDAYNQGLCGQPDQAPAPSYLHALAADQAYLGSDRYRRDQAYWQAYLHDRPAPLFPSSTALGHQPSVQLTCALDTQDFLALTALAERLGGSFTSLIVACLASCLARLSHHQEPVTLGLAVHNRHNTSERAMLGMLSAQLPLYLDVSPHADIATAMRAIATALRQAMRHARFPLQHALRSSGASVQQQTPRPFDLSVSVEDFSVFGDIEMVGGTRQMLPLHAGYEDTALGMFVRRYSSRHPVVLEFNVNPQQLPLALAEHALTGVQQMLRGLLDAPHTPLSQLPLLPAHERAQLHSFNATASDLDGSGLLHHAITAQVRRTPQAIAVVEQAQAISYAELDARANQLAHHLIALGARPDRCVALCLQRGIAQILAVLAVLKASAAYLPLDPSQPHARIAAVLADAQPVLLLVDEADRIATSAALAVPIITIAAAQAAASHAPEHAPILPPLSAKHLAYVIYTSGSTGQPKGVMVSHHAVTTRLHALIALYQLGSQERVLQFATLAFDASVEELFGALCSGATLVLRDDTWLDTERFWTLCAQARISVVDLPTRFWAQLCAQSLDIPACVRQVIIGGEALTPAMRQRWVQGTGTPLLDTYGPTEAVVVASAQAVAADTPNGIGRPLANTRAYVLDHAGQLLPVGARGELYLGGTAVARGYLGRADLTAERFVPDPFADQPGARMYRSGDLACWRADGTLDYLGRNDEQIKLRGFRIELGEVTAALRVCTGVQDVTVLLREDSPGAPQLVAYLVGNTEPLATDKLRTQLAARLPDYMLPAAYVQLDRLPLTPNGKLDRQALPAPDSAAYAAHAYEAPQDAIEQAIAAIWRDLLGLDKIGRHDNFFALGGHSLLAVTLTERMRQQGLQADLRTLFATPTLAALAATSGAVSVSVPPNRIAPDSAVITPEMLPLVALTQAQIDTIVAMTPGGALNIQDIYPLAPLQEGIFFHHLLQREGDAYLQPDLIAFNSRSRLDRFVDALQRVIDRHDILRTAVVWEGLAAPLQVVWRRAALVIEEVCLDAADGDVAAQLQSRFDPSHWRLDVRQAPLMRGFVAQDPTDGRWLLHLLSHHLALDHTTLEIVLEEVRCHLGAETDRLPAPLPFRNFVAQAVLGVSREAHEAYFHEMLGDVEEPCAPFGLVNAQGDGADVEEVRLELPDQLSTLLRKQSRALGVSAASLFHLAWAQVVARATGHESAVFGTVLFGRMQGGAGADRALGVFINTLPLRIEIDGSNVVESVRVVQQRLAGLLRHEHAPLSLVQRCSGVPAPAPLFTSLLNYRHSAQAEGVATTMAWEGIEGLSAHERTNYPLAVSVDDLGSDFVVTVQSQRPLAPGRTGEFLMKALEGLTDALAHAPETAVRDLDVLPEAERHQVLLEWNATTTAYPRDACVHELFEVQVARTPSAIAVVQGAVALSYGELNARANRLAQRLRRLGVGLESRVALYLPRGIDQVIAVLATLKAGAAYVPLDPQLPSERLAFLLEDSRPRAVLTCTALQDHLPASRVMLRVSVLTLDDMVDTQHDDSGAPHVPGLSPDNLAYIIYTSGSTGQPKGTLLTHAGAAHYLQWAVETYQPMPSAAVSSSLAFDATLTSLLAPLLCGAQVELLPEHDTLDALRQRLCDPTPLGLVKLTPAHLEVLGQQLVDHQTPLSPAVMVIGGEALPVATLARWQTLAPHTQLINEYGPTETVVGCVVHTTTAYDAHAPNGRVPIGRPIADLRLYVLDSSGQLAPIGVAGHLHIAGPQLARGYLGRADLTAERFVPDPFAEQPGARMYRSGDVACWRADGTLDYLGRNDDQVKLRGFRIELGEIAAALRGCAGVQDAAVLMREDSPGEPRLAAYVVGDAEQLTADTLRTQLAARLPDYMLPTAYVPLDALPLTTSGKLDRKALPAPDGAAYAAQAYEVPQGAIEQTIATIWGDLLGLDKIGRHDNFFALGGHSLLAVRVASRLRQALGVEIGVAELFANTTPQQLAACVASSSVAVLPPITPLQPDAPRVLSFAQQRLWFLSQFEGVSEAYHISGGLRLRGALDTTALQRALDRIVARHASLRTTFALVDGQALQQVAPEDIGFHLIAHDLRHLPDRGTALEQLNHHRQSRWLIRMSPSKGPTRA